MSTSTKPNDPYHIYERLLQQVRKELQNDLNGVERNKQTINSLNNTNEWLNNRIKHNEAASETLLKLMQS